MIRQVTFGFLISMMSSCSVSKSLGILDTEGIKNIIIIIIIIVIIVIIFTTKGI